MDKMLQDILALFNQAYSALTTSKDPVTARAYYNMAQDRLTDLEGYEGIGSKIKQARARIRAHLLHEKSLHKRMEASAQFWAQAFAALAD